MLCELLRQRRNGTSGGASNLLAHEDLEHLRRLILGIYKPSSITLIPHIVILLKQHENYLQCSGKKDSSAAPSLFFLFFWILVASLALLNALSFGLFLGSFIFLFFCIFPSL